MCIYESIIDQEGPKSSTLPIVAVKLKPTHGTPK